MNTNDGIQKNGFIRDQFISVITFYATTALTWTANQVYKAFIKGEIRSPLFWAAAAIALGLALTALILLLSRRLETKRPLVVCAGIISAAAVIAGLVIAINLNPTLIYRDVISPITLADNREPVLPADSKNLDLRISGTWQGSFLYELEKRNGTAWDKLDINGPDPAKEIENSTYYRIRQGKFLVLGEFRQGDVLRINILNASSFEGTVNFELYSKIK